jgi:hypothetical protein
MPNPNTKKFIFWSVDHILFPLFILLLAYHPFYKHGLFLSWDEGYMLSWANAIELHQVPLKDFYINFGPAFPYITVFALKIFGNTVAGMRSFMFFGTLASAVAAYLLGRQLIKSRVLLAVLCWFITSSCFITFWMSRWGGIRCLAMIIPAMILFRALSYKKISTLIWFGVASGICFLITQEAGIVAIIMFLAYMCLTQGNRLKDIAVFSVSFFAIAGTFYLYLILRGATMELILLNTLKIPLAFLSYYSNPPNIALRPLSVSIDSWLAYLQSGSFDLVFSVLIYVLSLIYIFINRRKHDARFILMAVCGIVMFIMGLRGFTGPVVSGPQFRWGMLGTGVIGIFFLQQAIFPLEKKAAGKKTILMLKTIFVLVLFIGLILSKVTPDYIAYMRVRYIDIELPALSDFKLERLGDARLPEAQARTFSEVTRLILANTDENEVIYAFPHEPQYYFLAKRRCADIFTGAIDSGVSEKLQEEAVARLEKSGVRYAIMVQNSYQVTDNRPIPNEERIALVYSYFSQNFSQVAAFGKTIILKRK